MAIMTQVPAIVEEICRLYTAGLLLVRDYGYNTDTELTSKDGYRKIELAKELLTSFRENGGACGNSGDDTGLGSIAARSDGDFFDKGERPCSDHCFNRGC